MSRYSCRATLCCIFHLAFSQCRTRIALHPLKCLKKGPVAPVRGGGCRTSTLHCLIVKLCRSTGDVAATVSRVALHRATKFRTQPPKRKGMLPERSKSRMQFFLPTVESFLLTVEVFCLQLRFGFFTYSNGLHKQGVCWALGPRRKINLGMPCASSKVLNMVHGLTIVWETLFSRLAMPRKNNNSCSTCLYLSDNTSCSKYAESPVFLRGSGDGNDVSPGILCLQQKDFRQRMCWCQTNYETRTLRKLRSDQIGCWSVGTCAQADVTGPQGGDRFLRGVHACDGFLHLLFFLPENPR